MKRIKGIIDIPLVSFLNKRNNENNFKKMKKKNQPFLSSLFPEDKPNASAIFRGTKKLEEKPKNERRNPF